MLIESKEPKKNRQTPEARAESLRKYYQSHKHKNRRYWELRPELRAYYHARRRSQPMSWANEFFIKEAYELARLRTKATGVKWEVDHIVPLNGKTVSGLLCEFNIQVIPLKANRRKGNSHAH